MLKKYFLVMALLSLTSCGLKKPLIYSEIEANDPVGKYLEVKE